MYLQKDNSRKVSHIPVRATCGHTGAVLPQTEGTFGLILCNMVANETNENEVFVPEMRMKNTKSSTIRHTNAVHQWLSVIFALNYKLDTPHKCKTCIVD